MSYQAAAAVPGARDETDDEWLPQLEIATQFGWPVEVPLPA